MKNLNTSGKLENSNAPSFSASAIFASGEINPSVHIITQSEQSLNRTFSMVKGDLEKVATHYDGTVLDRILKQSSDFIDEAHPAYSQTVLVYEALVKTKKFTGDELASIREMLSARVMLSNLHDAFARGVGKASYSKNKESLEYLENSIRIIYENAREIFRKRSDTFPNPFSISEAAVNSAQHITREFFLEQALAWQIIGVASSFKRFEIFEKLEKREGLKRIIPDRKKNAACPLIFTLAGIHQLPKANEIMQSGAKFISGIFAKDSPRIKTLLSSGTEENSPLIDALMKLSSDFTKDLARIENFKASEVGMYGRAEIRRSEEELEKNYLSNLVNAEKEIYKELGSLLEVDQVEIRLEFSWNDLFNEHPNLKEAQIVNNLSVK